MATMRPPTSPQALTRQLAQHAHALKQQALHQLDAPPMRQLAATLSAMLGRDPTDDELSDTTAQVLAYGLFAARWMHHTHTPNTPFDRTAAAQAMPRATPLLDHMIALGLSDQGTALFPALEPLLAMLAAASPDMLRIVPSADPVLRGFEERLIAA
ncbi:MAG: hypothetical protein AAFX99_05375, partial [Myxococcota bacterium]